jgi:NitT/TauT family transport system permease protein
MIHRRAWLVQAAFALLFCGLWELVTRRGWVDPLVLPSLTGSLRALWDVLHDASFVRQSLGTLARVGIAFLIAAPSAILLGLVIAERTHFARILNPALHFVLAVPQSIFLPLFILVFGVGDLQKIVFGVTHAFFIIAVSTVSAVESVPRGYVVAAHSFGASRRQTFFRVYVPAMLPILLTGMRIGMILNIVAILFAEMYASSGGLGMLIMQWTDTLQMERAMGAILLVSAATILMNEGWRGWENRVNRWQISAAER